MNAPAGQEKSARRVIVLGAVAVAIGIALTGSAGQGSSVGGVALVVGWLALVVGIHRFGRLGAP
jgi:hypothetical protein